MNLFFDPLSLISKPSNSDVRAQLPLPSLRYTVIASALDWESHKSLMYRAAWACMFSTTCDSANPTGRGRLGTRK